MKVKKKKEIYKFSRDSLESLELCAVISYVVKEGNTYKHKIWDFNSQFFNKFLIFFKEKENAYLEDFFGSLFFDPGLNFFTFEKQLFYVLNIPLDSAKKLHIFFEEKNWMKFPYWFHTERLASLGKLAGEIAHELKNPLSGILLYANMIKEEIPSDAPYKDWVEKIIALTNRCKIITKGLLDFGKPERGKKEWLNLNEVLKRVYQLISEYQLFKNIKVNWNLWNDLPMIYANKTQIEQVFFNLFTNAAEAMKGKGEITVETFVKNDNIIIKIKDTGPGIPLEIMPFIFDPFFTTKDKTKGTGLGLSICHGIIKRHGGQIRVYNLREGGACVEINISLPTREALREDAL